MRQSVGRPRRGEDMPRVQHKNNVILYTPERQWHPEHRKTRQEGPQASSNQE